MAILDTMLTTKFTDCEHYWFVPAGRHSVYAVQKESDETDWRKNIVSVFYFDCTSDIYALQITEGLINTIGSTAVANICDDWSKFVDRPEFEMMLLNEDTSVNAGLYERALAGALLVKTFKATGDPDSASNRISRCLEWLRKTDFYTCPASTQYHDSFRGGLLAHSMKVCYKSMQLAETEIFTHHVSIEDAIFVALVHDWCKIGLYVPYMRNVKDETTGQWNQVESYKYAENRTTCFGHGVSSMYLASRFFNLTVEESLAIRWHMGRYSCADFEAAELAQANADYPLVHLLQFADQLAVTTY